MHYWRDGATASTFSSKGPERELEAYLRPDHGKLDAVAALFIKSLGSVTRKNFLVHYEKK
jgi:hypothetical protein